MAANDFYQCFLCNTNQRDLNEFDVHLKSMEHVRCLATRNLLSAEHFQMLLTLHDFSFSENKQKQCFGNISQTGVTTSVHHAFPSNRSSCDSGNGASPDSSPQIGPVPGTGSLAGPNSERPNHSRIEIECLLCDKKLMFVNTLIQHAGSKGHIQAVTYASRKHNIIIFKCKLCRDGFNLLDDALQHSMYSCQNPSTNGDFIFRCDACDLFTIDVPKMESHLASWDHSRKAVAFDDKKFLQCVICESSFGSKDALSQHARSQSHKSRVILKNQW